MAPDRLLSVELVERRSGAGRNRAPFAAGRFMAAEPKTVKNRPGVNNAGAFVGSSGRSPHQINVAKAPELAI
jgi:hypothetical protein